MNSDAPNPKGDHSKSEMNDLGALNDQEASWSEFRRLENAKEMTPELVQERLEYWIGLYQIRISTTLIARWFAVSPSHVRQSLVDAGVEMDRSTRLNSNKIIEELRSGSSPQTFDVDLSAHLESMEANGEVNFYRAWKTSVGDSHMLNYSTFCKRAESLGYASNYRQSTTPVPSAMDLFELVSKEETLTRAAEKIGISLRTLKRWIDGYSDSDLKELQLVKGFPSDINPFYEVHPPRTAAMALSTNDLVLACKANSTIPTLAKALSVSDSTVRRRIRDLSVRELMDAFEVLVEEGRIDEDDELEIPVLNLKLGKVGVIQMPFGTIALPANEEEQASF